eukprot:jgi/Tetstr1/427342/TSEL_017509.t1
MQVVHEKPETRRPLVFKQKTWDEQWMPTDEYGNKQAILRDKRAEVEQHDNDVYVGEVLYFLEVTHTSPSVPDLTLAVCRLNATERMVIRSPLGTGSNLGTGVKNASADGPSILSLRARHGLQSTLKAKDKAVLLVVFDECWPRDTRTGVPYPLKKTHMFPIAAPPYNERICYITCNYRAGYTADNVIYAKEAVIAAFREYTHCEIQM